MPSTQKLALLAAACAIGAGCCTVPETGKYFDRRTPMSALLGFAYAIEVGDWGWAFETLDRRSREEVGSPFRLRMAAVLEEEPEIGVSVRELITEAIRYRLPPEFPPVPDPGTALIEIIYAEPGCDRATDGNGANDAATGDELPPAAPRPEDVRIFLGVLMVREEGEWRVDLVRTLQRNYSDQVAGAR